MQPIANRTPFHRLVFVLLLLVFTVSPGWGARLKDIASFKGIRTNQLVGYGLVARLLDWIWPF